MTIWANSYAQDYEDIYALSQKGKTLIKEKKYKEAVAPLAKAVKICPKPLENTTPTGQVCTSCHFNIAVCAFQLEQYDMAEKELSKVIAVSPNDYESYAERSRARTKTLKFNEALADIEKAYYLAQNVWHHLISNKRYWLTHNLAIAYRNTHQFEKALEYIEKAIAIEDRVDIRIEKVKILIKLGKVEEAETELNTIKNKGTSVSMSYTQGLLMMAKKNYAQAIVHFENVRDVEEDFISANRNLAFCLIKTNRLKEAEEYIVHLNILNQNNSNRMAAEAAYLQSLVDAKRGDWQKALKSTDYAESLLTVSDTIQDLLSMHRANIHYRQGDYHDAIGECQNLVLKNPRNFDANSLIAISYLEINQKHEAGNILSSIAHQGQNPIVQARLNWYLFIIGEEEKALNQMMRLVNQNPQNPEILYYYAEMAYQTGKFNKEESLFNINKCISLDPCREEAYTLKARILVELGDVNLAQQSINKAKDLGIHHSYSLYNTAQIYLKQNQTNIAEDYIDKAIEANYDALRFQNLSVKILMENKKWNNAIAYLDKILKIYPNHGNSLKLRGMAYAQTGKLNQAVKDLQGALLKNNNDAEIHLELAKVYHTKGNYSAATNHYKTAGQLDYHYTEVFYQYGRLFMDKEDYKNAEAQLDYALSQAQQYNNFDKMDMLYNDLALTKTRLKDYNGALGIYNIGIESYPNDLMYENRAKLLTLVGDNSSAKNDYLMAISLNANNPENYFNLGKIQKKETFYYEAVVSFTHAINIKIKTKIKVPDDYYEERGEAYFLSGMYNDAEKDYVELQKRNPSNWQPLYYLGKCKYEKADYDRAISYFSNAIVINNKEEIIYIARGDAYSQKEMYGYAAKDYGRAIILNPKELCYRKKKGHAHLRGESWTDAINTYDDAIRLSSVESIAVEIEFYHAKGRAYAGKAFSEGGKDATYQLAIQNYQLALNQEHITNEEKTYIMLNMMTTYEKWGKLDEMQNIKNQLPMHIEYKEEAVIGC